MNPQHNLSSQQIISAAQAMPLADLEKLVSSILAVRAERIAPHLSGQETRLLRIINKKLPLATLTRLKELQSLRDSEALTPEGFAELAQIIEKLEELHAARLNAVSKLAKLRGITFAAALQQIGLSLPDYE